MADRKYTILSVHYARRTAEEEKAYSTRVALLPWMTYRRQFTAIPGYSLCSDAGWGCMHRSGQMLLAEALLRTQVGDDWTLAEHRRATFTLFADTIEAPLSIHNIALGALPMRKRPGDWIGPNCMAQIAARLINDCDGLKRRIRVHVAMDTVVASDEINACFDTAGSPAVLLLVPLRLGLDSINPGYLEPLRRMFELKQSVGAIGGRPNTAFYFAGTSADNFAYLDPHEVQVSVGHISESTPLDSYQCQELRLMTILSADPSMCLGFFVL